MKKVSIFLLVSIILNITTYGAYLPISMEDNTEPEEGYEFFTTDAIAVANELKIEITKQYEIDFDNYVEYEYIEESAKAASMSIAEYKDKMKVGSMSVKDACYIMGNWYYKNVKTYQGALAGSENYIGRKPYKCDIFKAVDSSINDVTIYDDCTSFAFAVIALCSNKDFFLQQGQNLVAGSAAGKTFDDETWAAKYRVAGFETIKTESFTPKDGDIFIMDRVGKTSGHAEVVTKFNKNGTCEHYGWGSVKKQGPFLHNYRYISDTEIYGDSSTKYHFKLRSIIRQISK